MNIDELRERLNKAGVDPRSYRIAEPPDESTLCLRRQGRTWLVFHFERGTRYGLRHFASEAAACDYFLSQFGSTENQVPR